MVYLFLADGFEECEALAPLDILRRAGVPVVTVGVTGEFVTGAHNVTIKSDISIDEITPDESLTAVILPGGMPGTLNLEKNPQIIKAAHYAYKENKLICAICAAPKILGKAGILNGKNAVCFPGYENELTGAVIKKAAVVKDGNIITACGPAAAFRFGFEILRAIKGNDATTELYRQMQFPAVEA